ncbi:MAG: branched-chain amino acid ABC transporter ATP-binding protein/permease, partial [Candidatus Limnocylindria bacterium]
MWKFSPAGAALTAIRENRLRAAFLGIDVKRYELAAFTLAGAFDSLAGSLFALFNREAYPNLLFWTANALPIFIILIGGIRWLVAGPLVGAVAFVLLEEQVTRETGYPDLVFGAILLAIGAILLAIVLVAPGGLIGLVTSAWRRARRRPGEVAAPPPPVAPRDGSGDVGMNALLVTQGVAKSFNGFHAVDGVDLRVAEGERRAVIGPNGAGKTTLFSLLTGQLRPDAGTVRLAGRDITGLPPQRIAAAGISRAFQVTSIFRSLSILRNVQIALLAASGRTARLWGGAWSREDEQAEALLTEVGLAELADVPAGEVSHGHQRALELALALEPTLLLLDEPTAGMAPAETRRAMELVRRVVAERGITLLFCEHDMDVVF